ncbi:MAG: 4-hydroxy-tetrahydrodipicolinate reductase [Actinomycetaceae bacterium]|nr:4-hydroxy-tetrahydrodipicolinate reductase [Actinomycetaceae bacterium]
MIKVAVTGAKGRMGSTVCAAVEGAEDMSLVARLDQGDLITPDSLKGAQVVVDFSIPSATQDNVAAILASGADAVVGTTGWTAQAYDTVRAQLAQLPQRSAIIAPNFALSAVLAMSFAEKAAAYFESAEVIEMHHPNKVDAPSGTAYATAQAISRGRLAAGLAPMPDATETDPLGARGAVIEGVPVHAVRLRGLNAHEEILFGNPGEQLVIRSDCFDRQSFMPGVLLAVRKVRGRGGLTIGLEKILGI